MMGQCWMQEPVPGEPTQAPLQSLGPVVLSGIAAPRMDASIVESQAQRVYLEVGDWQVEEVRSFTFYCCIFWAGEKDEAMDDQLQDQLPIRSLSGVR